MIITMEPDDIRNINVGAVWQESEFVVDSGASETVIGDGMLSNISNRQKAQHETATRRENRQSG